MSALRRSGRLILTMSLFGFGPRSGHDVALDQGPTSISAAGPFNRHSSTAGKRALVPAHKAHSGVERLKTEAGHVARRHEVPTTARIPAAEPVPKVARETATDRQSLSRRVRRLPDT